MLMDGFPLRGEPQEKLRFGDAESSMWEKEEIKKSKMDVQKPIKLPKKPAFSSQESPGEKVRSIIQSVLPGQEYPKEFRQILQIGPRAIPTLVEIFQDSAALWQSRWIAAMALGRLGGKKASDVLKVGLNDPLFLLRMASAQALGNMGDLSTVPEIRKLLSDRALVVRASVADTLGVLKDRDSVPALIKELSASRNFHRGKSVWIRQTIMKSLGAIGDERAVPALMAALQEKELTIRLEACEALSRITPQAEPAKLERKESCVTEWTNWGKKESEAKGK